MAHDPELAEQIKDLLGAHPWTSRAMFGGLAFMVGGHMAVAIRGEGGLMVRVDPGQGRDLVADGVSLVRMGGRSMAGWLQVDPEAIATPEQLEHWVQTGVEFASTLPPKA